MIWVLALISPCEIRFLMRYARQNAVLDDADDIKIDDAPPRYPDEKIQSSHQYEVQKRGR